MNSDSLRSANGPADRLHVLHVLGELKPSGAETMLVNAAAQFRARGVQADVLSTGARPGPFAERFAQAGYAVHHLPFRRSPRFFWQLRALMRRGRYDVLHLHCEGANFWNGLSALSAGPATVIRTVHNAFAFTGNLQWRRGWQRRLLHRLGVRHVAITDSVRDTEWLHYRLPTTLVRNWYDDTRFRPPQAHERIEARASLDLTPTNFAIASIGNCSVVKNHRAIIEALALWPDPASRPLYLHAGIEEAGQPERALAQQLGLQDHVRFLGAMADVRPLLHAADAYVMPSLQEGLSIAALEALATGVPALFADQPGLCDFRANFSDVVYSGTDAASVAQGLQQIQALPSHRREALQARFSATAARLYGIERGVDEYVALYRQHQRHPAGHPAPMQPAGRHP